MPKKTYKPEEIIGKLREAEVRLSQGASVAEVVRALQVSEVTYYRWRKEYGGMRVDQAKRLKEIERENARLRKAVADLSLQEERRLMLYENFDASRAGFEVGYEDNAYFSREYKNHFGNPPRRDVQRLKDTDAVLDAEA